MYQVSMRITHQMHLTAPMFRKEEVRILVMEHSFHSKTATRKLKSGTEQPVT